MKLQLPRYGKISALVLGCLLIYNYTNAAQGITYAPTNIVARCPIRFTSSLTGTDYYWNFGSLAATPIDTGANLQSAQALFTGPGTTWVKLQVLTVCCGWVSDSVQVTINPDTLHISLTESPGTICQGHNITFTANPASYQQFNFFIQDSGVLQSSSNTYTTSSISPGDSVSVVGFNGTCYTNRVTVYPSVNPIPPPPGLTFLPANDTICGGDTVTFTASSGYSLYGFSNNSSLQQVSIDSVWKTNQLGLGNSITVRGQINGCFSLLGTPVIIVVNPTPTVTLAPATDTLCNKGAAITLTGAPQGGTYTGTGITGNSFNPAAANLGVDTITYAFTDANGCSSSASSQLRVVPFPDSISVHYFTDGQGVNVMYIVPQLAGSLTWQVRQVPGDSFYNASNADTFNVVCGIQTVRPIDTIIAFQVEVRAVFSLNGCVDTSASVTLQCQHWGDEVKNINPANLFSLYPNPADDYVTIDFDATYTGSNVFVKDITGRELQQTKLVSSPQVIPTGNLAPGVYMVTLYNNGQVGAKLLVKR